MGYSLNLKRKKDDIIKRNKIKELTHFTFHENRHIIYLEIETQAVIHRLLNQLDRTKSNFNCFWSFTKPPFTLLIDRVDFAILPLYDNIIQNLLTYSIWPPELHLTLVNRKVEFESWFS